jgi:hypothetical protein
MNREGVAEGGNGPLLYEHCILLISQSNEGFSKGVSRKSS